MNPKNDDRVTHYMGGAARCYGARAPRQLRKLPRPELNTRTTITISTLFGTVAFVGAYLLGSDPQHSLYALLGVTLLFIAAPFFIIMEMETMSSTRAFRWRLFWADALITAVFLVLVWHDLPLLT